MKMSAGGIYDMQNYFKIWMKNFNCLDNYSPISLNIHDFMKNGKIRVNYTDWFISMTINGELSAIIPNFKL